MHIGTGYRGSIFFDSVLVYPKKFVLLYCETKNAPSVPGTEGAKIHIDMPRKPRETSGTGIYHVMLRGVNKQDIFEDEEDYRYFRKVLYQQVMPVDDITNKALPARCQFYAYCLMPNHVHLLVRETSEKLSSVVHRIAISYAYYYNKKYERCGHLFQDRFLSQPVNDSAYFFTLLQYIHQNPLAAGIDSSIGTYEWSSWGEYERHAVGVQGICSVEKVLNRMSYADLLALVNTPLAKTDSIIDINSGRGRTDDEVRAFMSDHFGLRTPEEVQHCDKSLRNEILRQAKAFGATIQQLSRMTGISRFIVKRA